MGEFVKKTLMGYKEVPDGQSDPECTHVILTETEYAKLQRKISDAEQLARTTKYEAEREVDSARRDADYKIRQNVEKANQTIKRWSEALDAERAESGHLRSLNENLLRIARERANADRKLKPKKEHTGYSVVFSTEKEHRYGKGKNMTRVMLWETVIQSPYSIDLPEGLVRKQITDELTRVNEDGESLICRIGIDSFYPGSYAAMLQKRKQIELFEESEDDEEPEKPKGENIMLRPYFRANFKAGYGRLCSSIQSRWELFLRICGRGDARGSVCGEERYPVQHASCKISLSRGLEKDCLDHAILTIRNREKLY